jgi:hypothetical protein
VSLYLTSGAKVDLMSAAREVFELHVVSWSDDRYGTMIGYREWMEEAKCPAAPAATN